MHITWTRKLIKQERERANVGSAYDTRILANNILRFSWQCPGTSVLETVYVHQDGRIKRKSWRVPKKPLMPYASDVPF